MSIHILLEKIKSFLGSEKGKDIFVGIVVVCVAISSFVLGRLSVAQKDLQNPVVVKFDPSVTDYFIKKGESGESSALLGDEETSPSLKEKSSLEENGGGDSTAEEKEVLGAKEEKGDAPAWISSHPATVERIKTIQGLIEKQPCPPCVSLTFDWPKIQAQMLELGSVKKSAS